MRDRSQLQHAMTSVDGIVHLAAVSRVIWGELDPEHCWATNVGGLQNVLALAAELRPSPWIIFASSREVYGQPEQLPVNEDFPLRPVNIYGRSKAEGERLVTEAQRNGTRTCIVRLSNVFGSTEDHPDRVVPSFARAAALGHELRVGGTEHTFDFAHIDDIIRGLASLVHLLSTTTNIPPPIHFVSGRPTTPGELAALYSACKHQLRHRPIKLHAHATPADLQNLASRAFFL